MVNGQWPFYGTANGVTPFSVTEIFLTNCEGIFLTNEFVGHRLRDLQAGDQLFDDQDVAWFGFSSIRSISPRLRAEINPVYLIVIF